MSKIINQLTEFRDKYARKEGVESFKVLQYKTIEEIARTLPSTLAELSKIKGIGPTKLKKYGQEILEIVGGEETTINPEERDSSASLGMTENSDKQTVSVAQYLEYLNVVLSKTADVKIRGEISAPKEYPNGIYFTLKDKTDEGVLQCFIPMYTYKGLGIPLSEGMEVLAEGLPRLVRRNGRFQLTVENLELEGEGSLKKAYELLKEKLALEGLFERKRKLPECIASIGVITSKSGAVIHDFKNNLDERGLKIFLKDVRVEGNSAPGQILSAISYFNGLSNKPDCIVIMRGGGSLEDLQAFNLETVARAVFGSSVPVIAAIGHDQDVPLACLSADVYTSTPTAAAVLINKSWQNTEDVFRTLSLELETSFTNLLGLVKQKLRISSAGLLSRIRSIFIKHEQNVGQMKNFINSYEVAVVALQKDLKGFGIQIANSISNSVKNVNIRLDNASRLISSASPERSLRLGFSILQNKQGKIIRSKEDVKIGDEFAAKLIDGEILAEVKEK